MSQQNRISVTIQQPVHDDVMDHIAQIKLLLIPSGAGLRPVSSLLLLL